MTDINYPLFIFKSNHTGVLERFDKENLSLITTDPDTGKHAILTHSDLKMGDEYVIDCYRKATGNVTSLIIMADATSDFYCLEGYTLMRRENDGQDIPIMVTMPKVKMRSSFEIPISRTGDPTSISFVFDAYPTDLPQDKDIMVIIDIIEDDEPSCHYIINK